MKILDKINEPVSKVKPYQPGRPIEDVARDFGLNADDIVKIASNESVLGVSPLAQQALVECMADLHRYPDAGAWELRDKLAQKMSLDTDQFIFGAGSNEILVFLAQVFLAPGKSVVASAHAFVIYKILTAMMGADFIEVPVKDGLQHDLEAMVKAITPETSLVFVCNPNNPTGTLISQEEIETFMDQVPDDVLVVFDEAYAEICLGEMPDTLSFVKKGKTCIVLRTFSKAYGLAGIRIGYGMANAELISELNKPRQPFNANLAAQKMAVAALDDEDFLEASIKAYRDAKSYYQDLCKEMQLEYIPSYANFIMIKTGNGAVICNKLMALGVIVRSLQPYLLDDWIRVSFGTETENQTFGKAIQTLRRNNEL
ncbi:histidinol-phosphate transaminase [Lentisphaera profundi]|uniref:Histidinol-phosphate aminotransferase n=1 Tax=Lentisphaera profundi TaxID=1658616 RepID=A0ABY7VS19_9BACT|nr:histidinol-phosphate transaminase [Lentisphaera profundi]WDE97005.1 histidinol-phosphate transaminase [Lentisphaera profundi]